MHLSLSILFLRALSGGGKRRAIDSNACSGGEGAVAASWLGRTMVHPHTAASFAFSVAGPIKPINTIQITAGEVGELSPLRP